MLWQLRLRRATLIPPPQRPRPKLLEAQLDGVQRELEGKLDPAKATSITARVREAVKSDVAGILEHVRKELDLTNHQSPIRLLQTDVTTKLQALDEKVAQLVTQAAVKSAVSIEHLRGTQKGVDFEDAVHSVLGELTRHRKDQLERTRLEAGLNGRSKRGDFLIEVNAREAGGPGLNIVVEAKHNHAKHRDLLRELDLAMDNRNARFGIGISTSRELLPSGAPPIEFGADDKILIRVDDYDSDSGQFDSIYLEVALSVARFVSITNREPQPCQLNVAQLDGNVAQAINALTRLSQLKKHLTSIVGTANEAYGLVDAIRQEIREALQAIRDAIQDGLGPDSVTPPVHLKSA